jgi:hypothetical protein
MRKAASLSLVATIVLYATIVEHASAGPLHLFHNQEATRPPASAEFQARGVRGRLSCSACATGAGELRTTLPILPVEPIATRLMPRCVPNRRQR